MLNIHFSLQSKFANTKKKILDTIKEKKKMSSSPKDWPLQVEVCTFCFISHNMLFKSDSKLP